MTILTTGWFQPTTNITLSLTFAIILRMESLPRLYGLFHLIANWTLACNLLLTILSINTSKEKKSYLQNRTLKNVVHTKNQIQFLSIHK